MDFIRSTSEKMNRWPVEHFFPPFFTRSVLIWKKTGEKSVQLVRGSFFRKYFLWNPYFSCAAWNVFPINSLMTSTSTWSNIWKKVLSLTVASFLEFVGPSVFLSTHFFILEINAENLHILLPNNKNSVLS